MPIHLLSELTWRQLDGLDRSASIAILPSGATEAHGPHLPLGADDIIAEAMAAAGAEELDRVGRTVLILPTLHFTAAPFAAGFPGTLSVRPETVAGMVMDLARSLERHGIGTLVLANAHFDPAHVACLHAAAGSLAEELPELRVVFPDVTRRPWALRLTEEFRSGACHAGSYETSIVMARRPDLVRERERLGLEPHPVSLSRAIRDGLSTFEEAGGEHAYFGDPRAASPEEGRRTIATLGRILAEAVLVSDD